MTFSQNILGTYMHLLHIKFSKFSFTVKYTFYPGQKVKEQKLVDMILTVKKSPHFLFLLENPILSKNG